VILLEIVKKATKYVYFTVMSAKSRNFLN